MTIAIFRPANVKVFTRFREEWVPLFVKVEDDRKRLSFTGVVGPHDHDAWGSCGQIDMDFAHRNPEDDDKRYGHSIQPDEMQFAPGWTAEMWLDLLDAWKRWHLNDMRPWCEHQRDWPFNQELELQELTWGPEYHRLRDLAERGRMTTGQYQAWPMIIQTVENATLGFSTPKHPDLWNDMVQEALELGYLKIGKVETKAAGWTDYREHPSGLLSKPCDVCGYAYGSLWRFEPVPDEVIEFLNSLPAADMQPAWI